MSLDPVSLHESVRAPIARLLSYVSPTPELSIASMPDKYTDYPRPRFAAVLVLLYHQVHPNHDIQPDRDDGLRVLLTTRSKSLRSHPGQTALPGGKSDPEDGTPLYTAFREANEEIGLAISSPHVHVLTTLPTHLSLFKILVTPIVAFCSQPELVLPQLRPNESEVSAIFDYPLQVLLDPTILEVSGLSPKGTEDWPYDDEFHSTSDVSWLSQSLYRMNRFRSEATPVKGLTADILILVARIAYDREPSYARYAPGQTHDFMHTAIEWTMDDAKRNGGWVTGSKLVEPTASATIKFSRREEEDSLGAGGWTPDMSATPREGTPAPALPRFNNPPA